MVFQFLLKGDATPRVCMFYRCLTPKYYGISLASKCYRLTLTHVADTKLTTLNLWRVDETAFYFHICKLSLLPPLEHNYTRYHR